MNQTKQDLDPEMTYIEWGGSRTPNMSKTASPPTESKGKQISSRRVSTDGTMRFFALGKNRRGVNQGFTPVFTKFIEGSFTSSDLWHYCGFKALLLDVVTDKTNMIVEINAIIEIYSLVTRRYGSFQNAVKLGEVHIFGNLAQGVSQHSKPEWNMTINVSCPFTPANADSLPPFVRDVGGPAPFITGVIHALFGTKEGIELLGLEGYRLPDTDAGTTNIYTGS